jgi:hypothetical protein
LKLFNQNVNKIIGIAAKDDIGQIQIVRNSVNENILSNPSPITDAAVEENTEINGKSWIDDTEKFIP